MRRSLRILSGLIIWWCCLAGNASGKGVSSIRISSQEDFERLDTLIKSYLAESPDSIDITIAPGNYFFHEGHISLSNIQAENTSIAIHGQDVRIYPDMHEGGSFSPDLSYYLFDDGTGPSLIFRSDTIRQARSLVRIVDRKQKICRVKIHGQISEEDVRDGYIYITEWFRGRVYRITGVKDDFVYFLADDLKQKRFLYNVNLDWTFSLQRPRYKLIHCGEARQEDGALCAGATNFLSVQSSVLGGLNCSGLSFYGNNYNPADPWDGLISFTLSEVRASFRDCRFSGMKSDCISIRKSDDILIQECSFSGNYRHCLRSNISSRRTRFVGNDVHVSGLSGDNVCVVTCKGEDFLVKDNTISDYGYGAICIGLHYTEDKDGLVSGLVEGNEIFQSAEYFRSAPQNLLMDSGAIYIGTQNDDVRIEGNYIHDIGGPTYNRGIFADDGASHIQIRRNRVENVSNYYCIDIDPRSAWKMRFRKNRKVSVFHHDITVCDNTVVGRVRIPRWIKTED